MSMMTKSAATDAAATAAAIGMSLPIGQFPENWHERYEGMGTVYDAIGAIAVRIEARLLEGGGAWGETHEWYETIDAAVAVIARAIIDGDPRLPDPDTVAGLALDGPGEDEPAPLPPGVREVIDSLADYAERFAELNGEPEGGDCRKALARARAMVTGG